MNEFIMKPKESGRLYYTIWMHAGSVQKDFADLANEYSIRHSLQIDF